MVYDTNILSVSVSRCTLVWVLKAMENMEKMHRVQGECFFNYYYDSRTPFYSIQAILFLVFLMIL